jgi:hypothetical protein
VIEEYQVSTLFVLYNQAIHTLALYLSLMTHPDNDETEHYCSLAREPLSVQHQAFHIQRHHRRRHHHHHHHHHPTHQDPLE